MPRRKRPLLPIPAVASENVNNQLLSIARPYYMCSKENHHP